MKAGPLVNWPWHIYQVKVHQHTNWIESFWAPLKQAHKGVYHKFSKKHLQWYVDEFAARAQSERNGYGD